jgi:hypothetical protein
MTTQLAKPCHECQRKYMYVRGIDFVPVSIINQLDFGTFLMERFFPILFPSFLMF